MKALFIAIALLFITNSLYSQKVLNSVAGRDYKPYSFTQNYYRIDKIDTFLVITDDYNDEYGYCSSMLFSLNNFNFIKRTDPIVGYSSDEEFIYLGYSNINGGEFWYQRISEPNNFSSFQKYSFVRDNNKKTREYQYFKSDTFNIEGSNLKGALLVGDTMIIQSKNSLNADDDKYYITYWDIKDKKIIKTQNNYILPNGKLPIKRFSDNLFLIEDETLFSLKENKSIDIYDEIRKTYPEIIPNVHAENKNINYLQNSNCIIVFYESVTKVISNGKYYTGFATVIIDEELKIKDLFFTETVIRLDSYNQGKEEIYYIDTLLRLATYSVAKKEIVKTINLDISLGKNKKAKDIHNVTYINDSLLLFTEKNNFTFSGINSSYLYNYNKLMNERNIYNDLYSLQNISISNDDKYIAALGKNRKLYIFDSNMIELKSLKYDIEPLKYNDTTRLYSELNFNSVNTKILVSASNMMQNNIVLDLTNLNIEHTFINTDSSFTSDWSKNGKYLAMNHKSNQIHLYNTSENYQLIRKLELPTNYQIVKIMFISEDTLCILSKDLDSKNDIIIKWNCPTYDYEEYKTNTNIFKVNKFDKTNNNVKVSKDKSIFYQDYEGQFVSLNIYNKNINKITIADRIIDYIPQYNFANLTSNNNILLYSNSHRENQKTSDSYLSIYNIRENRKYVNTNSILFVNDISISGFLQTSFTTRQFCNYAQFNNNPNKFICGSFDGTLSIIEFDNLLTSVETENINSLDKTSKVLVTGKAYEFRNNELYPVKLSVYNFNGISVSEIVLETSEQIDLAKYSNNEKLLLIKRENSLTGEVIDNKILIFQ